MDIDATVAQAVAAEQAQETTINNDVENQASEEVTQESEGAEPQASKEDNVTLPKKAINAISYRDKKIGKQAAELQALRAELARLQQPAQTSQAPKSQPTTDPNAPKEDDFDNYGDFLKAQAKYEIEQQFATREKQQSEQQERAKLETWATERANAVDQKIEELSKTLPDYAAFEAEMDQHPISLTPEQAKIALEADNVALAAYALHKEGRLYEVLEMSGPKFAMEIARAEVRGEQYLKQKPAISKAPNPLTPAKGNVGGGKSINDLKAGEFSAWLKS